MSKMVKCSNESMENVLNTLGTTDCDRINVMDDLEAGEVDIDNIDPKIMLYENNKSIRNLNHSLMKLVAVQQDSQLIAKNIPT